MNATILLVLEDCERMGRAQTFTVRRSVSANTTRCPTTSKPAWICRFPSGYLSPARRRSVSIRGGPFGSDVPSFCPYVSTPSRQADVSPGSDKVLTRTSPTVSPAPTLSHGCYADALTRYIYLYRVLWTCTVVIISGPLLFPPCGSSPLFISGICLPL